MTASKQRGAEELRTQIATLEAELADAERSLAALGPQMRAVEASAMNAIRSGKDYEARAFLIEQRSKIEDAAAIEADIKVLRAILDECYDFSRSMGLR